MGRSATVNDLVRFAAQKTLFATIWLELLKLAHYPERFAPEALGHNIKAVHRAYAKRALMKRPAH